VKSNEQIRNYAIIRTPSVKHRAGFTLRLPAITQHTKWWALGGWYVFFCLLYVFTGHFQWQPPMVLELWQIDQRIPFLSWTVWIYFSQYLLLLVTVWSLSKTQHLSRFIYSISWASLFASLIFYFFPVAFPRVPQATFGINTTLFGFLYLIDTPVNCFPSLHVALACLTVPSIAKAHKHWYFLLILWVGLIAISTLTTKQHYFVDVLGGVFLAVFCYWLSRQILRDW
jgi:membrane-associated phospholipid phosphatase